MGHPALLRLHRGHFRRLSFGLLGLALMIFGVPSCAPAETRSPSDGGSPSVGGGLVGGGSLGGASSSGGTLASLGGLPSGGTSVGVGGISSGGGGSTTGGTNAGGGDSSSGGDIGAGGQAMTGGAAAGGSLSDPVDVNQMVEAMGVGTNIGNTLENTTIWETGWGQPLISKAYIDGLASRGIKTVRVPVAWDTYANSGVIDATKAARVKEVVGMILAADMYALVNIHWDGGWIFAQETADEHTLTEATKTKFASYWTQISKVFEDVGHDLIFEGLNEEANFWVDGNTSGQPDYAAINELNQLFVTTVRAQAGFSKTRALLIAGFTTDIEKTCVPEFQVPTDPAGPNKLFLSLHYYTPYTFCGLDTVESWGSPATTWGTDQERADLNRLFDQAATFSRDRRIPIILGEFGVTLGENYKREQASRVRWMQAVMQGSLDRGIVPVLWDTGSEISRVDGAFSPEFQQVMTSLSTN
jgi:endoglucanase